MRCVVQRVSRASVTIDEKLCGSIQQGLLALCGFENTDTTDELLWMARKLIHLRIFNDAGGQMNLSLTDVAGGLLLVSQFTLHASTQKGKRPSFIKAARPELAFALYQAFIEMCRQEYTGPVATGVFGANMQVELLNDGPVTIIIDSKNRE